MYVHNLSSAFADIGICPSSAIESLVFESDSDRILLSLMCGSDEFYSAVLYTCDGVVTAERIDRAIGDYMLANSLHRAVITVRAMPPDMPSVMALMNVDVLYCAYTLPEGFDLSAAFHTLLQTQRVPPSAVLKVYGDMQVGADVSFRISGVKADGTFDSCEMTGSASDGFVSVDIGSMSQWAALNAYMSKVTMVSLFYGDAVKSFVVVDMPSFVEFRFRNCFNCPESVFVSGISEMVTDVSTDMAVCNGRAMQYNRSVTRSYEHTTAPLTRLEAAAVSQLVESHASEVCVGGEYYPVLFTDHELKVSNDDSTINSAKFTWRFSDSRPRLFGDSLSPLLESFGIFTHQFQDPFQ